MRKIAVVIITMIWLVGVFVLVISSECKSQSLGGYGGLTTKQLKEKITRNAELKAIRSHYRLEAEMNRAIINDLRRRNAELNYQHNKRVLERHKKGKN